MSDLRSTYDFPVFRRYAFRIAGRKYRLGSGGVRALEIMADIIQQGPHTPDVTWLLPFRPQIREIERINPSAVLTLVIDRADNEHLRYLAIWLRGRCGGTLGTSVVSGLAPSAEERRRRHVTRCLQRLAAWSDLRRIAETDPSLRVRRLATQTPSQPHKTRLTAFSQHIFRRNVPRSQTRLVVSPQLDLSAARRPRPTKIIRTVLERIHQLVTKETR